MLPVLGAILLAPACDAIGQRDFATRVEGLAAELAPAVEEVVGFTFRYPPKVAVRSTEQVREFLLRRFEADFPEEEVRGITLAYRLFGLLPDTVDLQALLVDLYTEQVVGFYDPRSDTLYVVDSEEDLQLRVVVGHELVHALQAQYAPVEDLLEQRGDNDRRLAAQAVLEGQGMLFSIRSTFSDRSVTDRDEFWETVRSSVRTERERMPVLGTAPLILREGLIFPYLGGVDFVRWFERRHGRESPFGDRLPISTEQILSPERYEAGDLPVPLRFEVDAVHEDNLGQFEMQVLFTQLLGSESTASAAVRDWGGDRYGVFAAGDDHALVWWTVWDTPAAADRFHALLDREWEARDGRVYRAVRGDLDGRPAVLLVDAPRDWPGLDTPPAPRVGN